MIGFLLYVDRFLSLRIYGLVIFEALIQRAFWVNRRIALCPGVFIVNFEHIWHLFQVFLISHIFVVQLLKNEKCSSVIRGIVDNPINRQRRFNVYKTSKQRRQCWIDALQMLTLHVYWGLCKLFFDYSFRIVLTVVRQGLLKTQ